MVNLERMGEAARAFWHGMCLIVASICYKYLFSDAMWWWSERRKGLWRCAASII